MYALGVESHAEADIGSFRNPWAERAVCARVWRIFCLALRTVARPRMRERPAAGERLVIAPHAGADPVNGFGGMDNNLVWERQTC